MANSSTSERRCRTGTWALVLMAGVASGVIASLCIAQAIETNVSPKAANKSRVAQAALTPATTPAPQAKPAPTTTPAVPPTAVAPSGKSLVLSDDLKSKGKPYYAQPGGRRQASFLSDAPFEKITGHTNAIIGFAIAGPNDNPAKLAAGEWQMPINSLRTGNSDRDQHLTTADWLDAAKFPSIIFQLKDVRDIKQQAGAKEPSLVAYTATLVGDMTIHGVTREVSIPDATIRFRPKNPHSTVYAEGDLLSIGCKHTLNLSDYNVTNAQITTHKKVANSIEIETQLLLASVPPEEQPDRSQLGGSDQPPRKAVKVIPPEAKK